MLAYEFNPIFHFRFCIVKKRYSFRICCNFYTEIDTVFSELGSKKSILFFVIALAVHTTIAELIINSPASIEGSYIAYPIIYRFNFRNETIDGEIVLANSSDVTDKIALVEYYRAEYLSQIRTQQNRGARAVIISAPPLCKS